MAWFRVSSVMDRYVSNIILGLLVAALPLTAVLSFSPSL
jgi:hypothetical protein